MPAKAVVVDGLAVTIYAFCMMPFMWVAQMVGQRLSDHRQRHCFTSAFVELCRPSEREK